MDYETLRQFADSWGLLFLVLLFVGIIIFVFRPGASKQYEKDAKIPLRDEEEDNG
ncbi:MAG: cbb3-type cytochrome c oxidase subunit 3 [Hyphomicrobiales bacterium]